MDREAAIDTLREYWGYDSFRPLQLDIIESVMDGHDTLGLLPTGGGKSITFQVPAMMLPGLTVVVTPLISLMKDQVDNLRDRGIRAVYLHAGLSRREVDRALDRCRLGVARILYLSPEKLQSPQFALTLRQLDISLIVVDEAHCISQWGYDFRPSYLKIAALREIFPKAPVLALTASATPEVARDIMAQLRFKAERMYARSFTRENLSYIVRYAEHKEGMLLNVLRGTTGSAIVYVRSRKRTREIAHALRLEGISAEFYHAGLSPEEKNEKQNRWKADELRVMVATNAFGMGIDKPDVRVVVHVDLPSSLEEYYQEAGRAGRDGKEAFAVLIVAKSDKALLTRRISDSFPDKEYIKQVYETAGNFLNVAVGSGFNTVNEFNFNLFCFRFSLKPIITHSALTLLSQAGYIEFVEEVSTRSRVVMLMQRDELYDLRLKPVNDSVLQMILRSYSGLFADYVYINEQALGYKLGLNDEQVYEALLALSRMHVLHYVPRKSTPYIIYTTSREEPRYIKLPDSIYKERRMKMEERIDAMKRFAFDTGECRVNTMLRYFGENPDKPCGKCDVCREIASHKKACDPQPLRDTIMYLAGHPGGASVGHIASQAGVLPGRVVEVARPLIDEGVIELVPPDILRVNKT